MNKRAVCDFQGGVEVAQVEGLAREVRRAAGAKDDEIPALTVVIAHWMGARSVELVDRMIGSAALVTVDGRSRIMALRSAPDLRFAIAHEFGHWALRRIACLALEHADEERAANTFAAAILAPAPLVQRAFAYYGEDHRVMASQLRMSQTSTVLRIAEVRGDERVVVTRNGNVLARNTVAIPRDRAVSLARSRASKGLAKARLRGGIDEGRVALRAV